MRKLLIIASAVVLGATLTPPPAVAVDQVDTQRLREAVTVNGILGHERVLQRIANENGGTRASGTPGYRESAAYVAQRLRAVGYQVTRQEFTFPFYRELAPAQLERVSPNPAALEAATMDYSGSGDVTGKLVPTRDILIPPSDVVSSTSGCEASDFIPASPTQPQVALIQRGTCTFEDKANNAQAAGYDAVLIFNEGQEGRTELLQGNLGAPEAIPVVGLSFATGSALYQQTQSVPNVIVHVVTSTEADLEARTTNIIADSPGGSPGKVLVVGAHLDSVVEGPGINDNGSGTSTILEIALQMARLGIQPQQKVRFAFWGAEEAGLLGSEHYVRTLPSAALSRIWANLNFDMVGSPNYVRFVYDGDGSSTPVAGPAGSGQIEQVFKQYFTSQGLASKATEFSGRSDYGPFIAVGIPAGGLFTGAEGIKTPGEAFVYGGTAGVAYDSCYHQACDTVNNVNVNALNEMGDAAAHATMALALTRTGFFPDGSRVDRQGVAVSGDHKGHGVIR